MRGVAPSAPTRSTCKSHRNIRENVYSTSHAFRKEEIVLPDAPAEQYAMVKTILANTVTDYLKEMGYFPGQLEMFKRLRSNNHDFFEETEQLQQIVNQQQHHIANLEHQIRQGAAELDRTTHDLHAVLRNYHTLAGSYDRL